MPPITLPRSEHSISRKGIDPDALKVLYRLHRAGHIAYLVGGGVRDLLLGRRPKDFDVSTSALPNEVRKLFRNCRLIGRRFPWPTSCSAAARSSRCPRSARRPRRPRREPTS